MAKEFILEMTIEETTGIDRQCEPVTQGIPFPHGMVSTETVFQVFDENGHAVPIATTPLAWWNDGSIKWLLFDFQVSLPAKTGKILKLFLDSHEDNPAEKGFVPLKIQEERGEIFIHTGAGEFTLGANTFSLFNQITINDHSLLRENASRIVLVDKDGREWEPHIDAWSIATQNPLRMVLVFEGSFTSEKHSQILQYICYVTFFAGKSITRINFTLLNPRAANHAGGVWDLGDKGAVFFRALRIEIATLQSKQAPVSYYALALGEPLDKTDNYLKVYQDSSGGENWRSRNHMNKDEEIPVTFRGFKVSNTHEVISHGFRATPCFAVANENGTIVTSLRHFWQNFPKALELDDGDMNIHLFPEDFNDLFELQGGEQKTHTFYVNAINQPIKNCRLDWVHAPLLLRISPEWYYRSGVYPKPVPQRYLDADASFSAYQNIVDSAVHGENSFFKRREIIDEYGWRNFGDLYADHEAVFHEEEHEFISHYNNQFDIIKGALIQFMRTGKPDWFQLADELARHVSDIDLYHTNEDRYEFNNGLFWHTDHHLDAVTSTHRCASRKHHDFKAPHLVGGGPSPSHNYATGLLYHYWLTGDPWSKKSVLMLADNMMKNLEGSDILLERGLSASKKLIKWLIRTGKSSLEEHEIVYEFNGPGRGSGNALRTLLDAYLLTSKPHYMACAEKLIQQCTAPDDDIDARNLLNVEFRWMYTIFLQSLGRYLDIKYEKEQRDDSFWYGREVLLKYANWMIEHEYPYLDKPDILEFPNESWSAQEIRKSDVLAHAAYYAPEPLRQQLLEKSRFFFDTCINQLQDDFAKSHDLTRVLAVLMTNGLIHMNVFFSFACEKEIACKDIDFRPNVGNRERQSHRTASVSQLTTYLKNTSFSREIQWLRRLLKG